MLRGRILSFLKRGAEWLLYLAKEMVRMTDFYLINKSLIKDLGAALQISIA
jgi:hypothetical protein